MSSAIHAPKTRCCERCGAPFLVDRVALNGKRFCSERCQASRPVRSPVRCVRCGSEFVPKRAAHRFCSRTCCEHYKASGSPEVVAKRRERCRVWAEQHRNVTGRNPWLAGAPPYVDHLPGGGFALAFSPPLRWPLELRNTRVLHGMITELIGLPHDPNMPMFTLVPTNTKGSQWSVWIADQEAARLLAGKRRPVRFADQEVVVECGALTRLRSPSVTRRGHQRIRVDCITPVCIRNNGSREWHVNPSSGNLTSTLGAWMPRRLGIDLQEDSLRCQIVSKHTESRAVDLGGKFGVAHGFDGWLELEVNAPARWLLEVAARGLGLGGKTAFGFGRIKVTEP